MHDSKFLFRSLQEITVIYSEDTNVLAIVRWNSKDIMRSLLYWVQLKKKWRGYSEDNCPRYRVEKIGNPIAKTNVLAKTPLKFGTKILELSRNSIASTNVITIGFGGTGSLQKFGSKNLEPSRNPIAKTFVLTIGFGGIRSSPIFGTKTLVPYEEKFKTL